MALTALTHKKLTPVTPAGSAIDDVLDAIATALASTTYYDGTTRTPGSGVAWTGTKQISTVTVAVRCHPVSGGDVDDLAIAIAGLNGAATPQVMPNVTYTADALHAGVFRNVPGSPTWNGWDNATPYTGADFSGYTYWSHAVSGDAVEEVHVFESQDTLAVFIRTAGGACHFFHGGGIIDPGEPRWAEPGGSIYGLYSCGTVGWTNLTSPTLGGPWVHDATAGRSKGQLFDPVAAGSTTLGIGDNMGRRTAGATQAERVIDGYWTGMPVVLYSSTRPHGRLREWFVMPDLLGEPVIAEGTADKAYCMSRSRTLVTDALAFSA